MLIKNQVTSSPPGCWLVKLDYTRSLVYAAIIGALLIARVSFRNARMGR